jgi:hypothetical protein
MGVQLGGRSFGDDLKRPNRDQIPRISGQVVFGKPAAGVPHPRRPPPHYPSSTPRRYKSGRFNPTRLNIEIRKNSLLHATQTEPGPRPASPSSPRLIDIQSSHPKMPQLITYSPGPLPAQPQLQPIRHRQNVLLTSHSHARQKCPRILANWQPVAHHGHRPTDQQRLHPA